MQGAALSAVVHPFLVRLEEMQSSQRSDSEKDSYFKDAMNFASVLPCEEQVKYN